MFTIVFMFYLVTKLKFEAWCNWRGVKCARKLLRCYFPSPISSLKSYTRNSKENWNTSKQYSISEVILKEPKTKCMIKPLKEGVLDWHLLQTHSLYNNQLEHGKHLAQKWRRPTMAWCTKKSLLYLTTEIEQAARINFWC